MSEQITRSIHWSFWLIGVVAFIWNGLGVVNYFVQMDPDALAGYRESERAIITGRPAWATAGFALAVVGGALGSLLLLPRRSLALYLFLASLLGVLVAVLHSLGSGVEFGLGESIGIILMPIAVSVSLIWYALRARDQGWLL